MITIIGDVHGRLRYYEKLTQRFEYTVQIGDMGFNYDYLHRIDADKHVFFGGNHDNYDDYQYFRHALGDFGTFTLNDINFFYVRGENSIDKRHRKIGIDWWQEEEIEYRSLDRAIQMYQQHRPNIMLSHGCPASIIEEVTVGNKHYGTKPSTTSVALQRMLDFHQPKIWIFGHHHRSFMRRINGCLFVCLEELETIGVGKIGSEIVVTL